MKAFEQLTLNIRLRDDATFDNFYAQNNQQLLTHLQTLSSGKTKQFTYIWGKPSSGRSHLLQACCHTANKEGLSSIYLPLSSIDELSPRILEGLEKISLICVDDIQNIAQKRAWEEAIFNIFNNLGEKLHSSLIISGNNPALSLPLSLFDLKSRLTGCLAFQVTPLTDKQKLEALHMRAKIRGIEIPDETAKFLLHRFARDTANLFSILDKLDQASLVEQRRITIPFVKKILSA
jgi:DnaA family protein